MDMSIFRETVHQHSSRVKDESIEDGLNNAIINVSFYSENAMK